MAGRADLLTSSHLRLDSRTPLELRELQFSIAPSPPGAIPRADGHAVVSHGLTRLSASVYGPREPQRGSGPFTSGLAARHDAAIVNVEVNVPAALERAGTGKRGARDKRVVELASSLRATFEPVIMLHLYPRSAIDIYIHAHSLDGSLLQAAINATSLALVSAGIPMSDYVCGLALASYPSVSPTAPPQIPPFELSSTDGSTGGGGGAGASGSTVLIDLVQAEEQALPCATIACTPRSGHVTLASLESRLSVDRFEQLLRWGVEGSKVIRAAMEDAVHAWSDQLAAPSKLLALPEATAVATSQVKESSDEEVADDDDAAMQSD